MLITDYQTDSSATRKKDGCLVMLRLLSAGCHDYAKKKTDAAGLRPNGGRLRGVEQPSRGASKVLPHPENKTPPLVLSKNHSLHNHRRRGEKERGPEMKLVPEKVFKCCLFSSPPCIFPFRYLTGLLSLFCSFSG